MKDKRILVTGGLGFIGSNFIRYILQHEPFCQVINLDSITYAGSLENLQDIQSNNYYFIKGDICDQAEVERILIDFKVDTIVHFAAETHVDNSIKNPEIFIETNIFGTFKLLEACRKIWCNNNKVDGKMFQHISTDEVYGSLREVASSFTEESCYRPNSPYSATKASSDHLVRAFHHTYGLPMTISHSSNNYGPYQFFEKLIPNCIYNGVVGNPITIYGDGSQIRDWLFVEDHCEALWLIMNNGRNGERYNIDGGNQIKNIHIVNLICDFLDDLLPESPNSPHRKLIKFISDRPGHDFRYEMDFKKIQNDFGWYPKHSLTEGLKKTVLWYLIENEWMSKRTNDPRYSNIVDEYLDLK